MAASLQQILTRCSKSVPIARVVHWQLGCLSKHGLHHSRTCLEKWQLMSAVCLERFPVITAARTETEEKFANMLEQQELERSLLCDHEMRHAEDLKNAERRKQEDYEETEADAVKQTAAEAEDAWENELTSFTPADRITEADKANDQRSLKRKLDRKLVLLVKQKLGDESHWVMPLGPREDEESMREAAERVLSSSCGDHIQASFMGNAPCGFLKYRYPEHIATKQGTVGAKVFFFKAQLQGGHVEKSGKDVEDFLWLTKDELQHYVTPSYEKVVDKFVLEL